MFSKLYSKPREKYKSSLTFGRSKLACVFVAEYFPACCYLSHLQDIRIIVFNQAGRMLWPTVELAMLFFATYAFPTIYYHLILDETFLSCRKFILNVVVYFAMYEPD